jgi:hypothetical protein
MPLILTPLESKIESISKDAFKNAMIKFKNETSKIVDNTGKDVFSSANDAASIEFANGMKNIAAEIDKYIKSATVTVSPGAVVVTSGTPSAQTGTVTSQSVGTIS